MSIKLEMTLIQQTPLLHFQYDKNGVTLRASEVKPKLDRFLLKKIKSEISEDDRKKTEKRLNRKGKKKEDIHFDYECIKDKYENWVQSPNTNGVDIAFKYKMRIEPCDNSEIMRGKNGVMDPPNIYYGNTGKNNMNIAYCLKGNCRLTIICFIPELTEVIKKNINDFFYCHNFGRMSGKGFGSYIVEGSGKNEQAIIKALIFNSGAPCCYRLCGYKPSEAYPIEDEYKKKDGTPGKRIKCKVFDDIKNTYQVMKSGYNNVTYHRSVLFEYFRDKGIGNEKRKMKLFKVDKDGRTLFMTPRKKGSQEPYWENKKNQNNGGEHKYSLNRSNYVRALLGVGEHVEFLDDRRKKHNIKISSNEIERFASPVFFKFINGTIYIVANRVNPEVFCKPFTFSAEGDLKFELCTPSKSEFDIDEFMEYFLERFNNEHVSDGESKAPISKLIRVNKLMVK